MLPVAKKELLKNQCGGSGSRMNFGPYSENFVTILWVKNTFFVNRLLLIRDGKIKIRDGKIKIRDGKIKIPDKLPGSATL
jgi:hypothetical protein